MQCIPYQLSPPTFGLAALLYADRIVVHITYSRIGLAPLQSYDLPEQAFLMCGGIAEVIKKAQKMAAEAA